MAALFSKPKTPKLQEAAPIPIVDQSFVDRQAGDMLRKRRGRAATDLTSASAAPAGTSGSVATKQLLGS